MGSGKDHGEIFDRVIEILVNILEQSGVGWSQNERDPKSWMLLAASIENLSLNLVRLQADTTIIGSSNIDQLLITLEENARDVRGKAEQLSREVEGTPDVLEQCAELQGICRSGTFRRLAPLACSLTSAILQQRLEIAEWLRKLDQYLATLYADKLEGNNESVNLVESLKGAASALSTRCVHPNQSPWKEAKAVVRNLVSVGEVNPDAPFDTLPTHVAVPDPVASAQPMTEEIATSGTPQVAPLEDIENIIGAALAFVEDQNVSAANKCYMLVGAEGSGKTFCLGQIEMHASKKATVIRPSLPFDVTGRKVGSAEDLLISMVSYVVGVPGKSILLLDDIETICGSHFEESVNVTGGEAPVHNGGTSGEPHLQARTRGLLLSLLETVQRAAGSQTLLICTARSNWGKVIDRFDRTFLLTYPNADSRACLFRSYFSMLEANDLGAVSTFEHLLSNVIECTTGLSYGELACQCRRALLEAKSNAWGPEGFLQVLKQQLQQAVPDSLKTGANSDFVDMRIFSLRDLQKAGFTASQGSSDSSLQDSLYGLDCESAWDELKRLIVTPICQASILHKLMFHNGAGKTGGKTFAGGVLITGDPGSGKTTLAFQCAALAASMNPSVKLLDVSCTSLIHKEVGGSEQAIHRLFQTARAAAPCILLMDGIENVAAVRGNDNTTEGTMDRVLSTLLTELDGVDSGHFTVDNPKCIAIVGITHNPAWVDPALRRPGRLERVLRLGLPELEARRKIVERELVGIPIQGFGSSEESSMPSAALFIAERTEGFSGAAIVGVCNEAKMLASRHGINEEFQYALTIQHLQGAIDSQKAGKGAKK